MVIKMQCNHAQIKIVKELHLKVLDNLFDSSHLGLNVFDADDTLLVFLHGFMVAFVLVELVSLTVQYGHNLQSLLIIQSP